MKHLILIAIFFIGACSSQALLDDYSHYLRNQKIPAPTLENFPHCYGYGCNRIEQVSLKESEWQQIDTLFKKLFKKLQKKNAIK